MDTTIDTTFQTQQLVEAIESTPINDAPAPEAPAITYLEAIKMLASIDPKRANKLLYHYRNTPGDIKVLSDTRYLVTPRGFWVKLEN